MKHFNIKITLFFIILLVLLASFFVGIYSNKKTIPDPSEVTSVKINIRGGDNAFSEVTIEESDNIQIVTNIHNRLTHYKDEDIMTWKSDVSFTYTLKDGSTKVIRISGIRDVDEYFSPMTNTDEYKMKQLDIFTMNSEKISKIIVEDSYTDRDVVVEVSDSAVIQRLIELSKEAALDQPIVSNGFIFGELTFYIGDQEVASWNCNRDDMNIYSYFKSSELLSPIIVQLNEIDYILVENKKGDKVIKITDFQRFHTILAHYYSGSSSMDSTYGIEIIMKDKESRHWYGSFHKYNEPAGVEDWF